MICPMLSICKAKVSYEQYINLCANVVKDAYKDCPEYKKIAVEQRTPLDWSRLSTPI